MKEVEKIIDQDYKFDSQDIYLRKGEQHVIQ